MSEFLRHFESIGENCEFGFVLHKFGILDGSLFRWANIRDFQYLIDALDGDLTGLFQPHNLFPRTPSLVRDSQYGLEFHTEMPIAFSDEKYCFSVPFEERKSIYDAENDKFQYLARKFLKGAARGSRIYVLKRSAAPIPMDVVLGVLRSLRRHGDATILLASLADEANPAGTARILQDNLYQGFVSHLAISPQLDDIDFDSWFEMCKAAWDLHTSLRGEILVDRPKSQPTELPNWFDAEGYLRANPDVAALGMDAAEHYLTIGWQENRTLMPWFGL